MAIFLFFFLAVTQFVQCEGGDPLRFIRSCIWARWDIQCRFESTVKCVNQQPRRPVWDCSPPKISTLSRPVCCDLVCP